MNSLMLPNRWRIYVSFGYEVGACITVLSWQLVRRRSRRYWAPISGPKNIVAFSQCLLLRRCQLAAYKVAESVLKKWLRARSQLIGGGLALSRFECQAKAVLEGRRRCQWATDYGNRLRRSLLRRPRDAVP